MAEFEGKKTHAVDDLQVPVSGGLFHVTFLLVDETKGIKGILDMIRDIPAERWFVIMSEDEGTSKDVLSLINDDFEYESIAIGNLNSEL